MAICLPAIAGFKPSRALVDPDVMPIGTAARLGCLARQRNSPRSSTLHALPTGVLIAFALALLGGAPSAQAGRSPVAVLWADLWAEVTVSQPPGVRARMDCCAPALAYLCLLCFLCLGCVCFLVLCLMVLAQPVMAMGVFCLMYAPFWPVNSVGITSFWPQKLP